MSNMDLYTKKGYYPVGTLDDSVGTLDDHAPLDSLDSLESSLANISISPQTQNTSSSSFVFHEFALNEQFQNVFENPFLARDAQKHINELSKRLRVNNIEQVLAKLAPEYQRIQKGQAGGDKQAGGQLFIKLCTTDPQGQSFYEKYSHAAKVAGHELKGLAAVLSCCQVSGFRVPLMRIIDYKGKRMVVMTNVPLTNAIPEGDKRDQLGIDKVLDDMAKTLNLRKHKIKTSKGDEKEIYFPADFEVHEGSDGRLYAIDLSRVMPPETPVGHLGYLFRLFRPEYVRDCQPLSPDAFAPFRVDDDSQDSSETKATLFLQHTKVPETARILSDEDQKDGASLKKFLHDHGINLRYLALFLHHLRTLDPKTKTSTRIVEIEVVARAFAHLVNEVLRSDKLASQRNACAEIFNDILDCNPGKVMNSIYVGINVGLRDQFKDMYLKHLIKSEAEAATAQLLLDVEYWGNVIQANGLEIFQRVSEMTGVVWDPKEIEDIQNKNTKFIRVSDDYPKLKWVVKTITIQPTAEVYRAKGEYNNAVSCYEAELRTRKKLLGNDHLRVAISLTYLAEACCELNTDDRRRQAERYFMEAGEIYDRKLSVASEVMESAINILKHKDDLQQSDREDLQREIQAVERRIAELNLAYAVAIERKAMYLLRFTEQLDFQQIDKLLVQSLEKKQLVKDLNEIVKTLNLQAWVSYHSSDYNQAEAKFNECLGKLQETQTIFKASVFTNLSLVNLKQNRIGVAWLLCEKAKELLQKESHWSYIGKIISAIEDNLGKVHLLASTRSEYASELEEFKEERVQSQRQISTPSGENVNPPGAASEPRKPTQNVPSTAQLGLEQKNEIVRTALQHFQKGKDMRQQILGDHHLTTMSMDHVAQAYLQCSKRDESYLLYEQALPLMRRWLGDKHSAVGILLHNIAIWYSLNDENSKALEAQKEATEILKRAFGEGHKLVVDSQNALSTYEGKEKREVLSMSHDRIVAPNQRDPASFFVAYQDEREQYYQGERVVSYEDIANKEYQTFENLLSLASGTQFDVSDDLTSFVEANLQDFVNKTSNNQTQTEQARYVETVFELGGGTVGGGTAGGVAAKYIQTTSEESVSLNVLRDGPPANEGTGSLHPGEDPPPPAVRYNV